MGRAELNPIASDEIRQFLATLPVDRKDIPEWVVSYLLLNPNLLEYEVESNAVSFCWSHPTGDCSLKITHLKEPKARTTFSLEYSYMNSCMRWTDDDVSEISFGDKIDKHISLKGESTTFTLKPGASLEVHGRNQHYESR